MSCDCAPESACEYASTSLARFLRGKRMWQGERHSDIVEPCTATLLASSRAVREAPPFVVVRESQTLPERGQASGLVACLVSPMQQGFVLGELQGHVYNPVCGKPPERSWDGHMIAALDEGGALYCVLSTRQCNVAPYSWMRFVPRVVRADAPAVNAEYVSFTPGRVHLRMLRDERGASARAPVEIVARYGAGTAPCW